MQYIVGFASQHSEKHINWKHVLFICGSSLSPLPEVNNVDEEEEINGKCRFYLHFQKHGDEWNFKGDDPLNIVSRNCCNMFPDIITNWT